MASLPYVTAPGNIKKALDGIISASTPDRVTQDFVKTILQIPGGSGDQMTSFLKKLGFANSDGTPTDLYRQFRNEGTRGAAAAAALKKAYEPLFKRNEYAHELPDAKLRGLIIEETGASDDSSSVTNVLTAIRHLKAYADFSGKKSTESMPLAIVKEVVPGANNGDSASATRSSTDDKSVGLNLSYTINLNLPATSDIAVFNAIFKSLKENLLRSSDE